MVIGLVLFCKFDLDLLENAEVVFFPLSDLKIKLNFTDLYFAQIKTPYSCRKATPKLCSLAGGANGLQLSWVDFHIPIAFKYKTLLIKIIKLDLYNI